jgi:hypothetical protein
MSAGYVDVENEKEKHKQERQQNSNNKHNEQQQMEGNEEEHGLLHVPLSVVSHPVVTPHVERISIATNTDPLEELPPMIPSGIGPSAARVMYGYCSVCRLVKPERAKHCYKCKHCVMKFDHHCPFMANCIGGANHAHFFWFLTMETVVLAWCFILNFECFNYPQTDSAWYTHIGQSNKNEQTVTHE